LIQSCEFAKISVPKLAFIMTVASIKPLTLEEYLNYDDGTDNLYELVPGELVAIPPESSKNVQIVDPQANRVCILTLIDGLYEETEFTGNAFIVSSIFSELQLTAEQILQV
jgi:Uma2 family endonuclease